MINEVRSNEEHVVLLDAGGFTSPKKYERELTGEVMMDIFGIMSYDAVTLATEDLQMGEKFLDEARARGVLPLVTSNLVYRDTGKHYGAPYAILARGKLRLGIVGIMDPSGNTEREPALGGGTLKVLPPREALAGLVPKIRDKVDFLILLSRLDKNATIDLVTAITGIDLSLYPEGFRGKEKEPPPGVHLLSYGKYGTALGYVRIVWKGGLATIQEGRTINLACGSLNAPVDEAVSEIIGTDFQATLEKLEAEKRALEDQKRLEEARELWKSSPLDILRQSSDSREKETEIMKKKGNDGVVNRPSEP